MRARSLLVPLTAAALAAQGCTLDPGGPFATVRATLDGQVVVAAGRDAGDGFQRLDTDYQVRFDAAALGVEEARLVELLSLAAFDPANPPPGYTNCHNGHCHATDGSLVSYEEIARILSGGVEPPPVLVLAGATLSLVAGAPEPLACPAGCALPYTRIGRAELRLVRLALQGVVRDARSAARIPELPFVLELLLDPEQTALDVPLDLRADRRRDPDVALELVVLPTAALLDGVDFAAHVQDGVIDLGAGPKAAETATRIRQNLLETLVLARISRS